MLKKFLEQPYCVFLTQIMFEIFVCVIFIHYLCRCKKEVKSIKGVSNIPRIN